MNPMEVLQPNTLGTEFANTGVENLNANVGWGVSEVMQSNPAAAMEVKEDTNPAMSDLRRAKSREFGMTIPELGF